MDGFFKILFSIFKYYLSFQWEVTSCSDEVRNQFHLISTPLALLNYKTTGIVGQEVLAALLLSHTHPSPLQLERPLTRDPITSQGLPLSFAIWWGWTRGLETSLWGLVSFLENDYRLHLFSQITFPKANSYTEKFLAINSYNTDCT